MGPPDLPDRGPSGDTRADTHGTGGLTEPRPHRSHNLLSARLLVFAPKPIDFSPLPNGLSRCACQGQKRPGAPGRPRPLPVTVPQSRPGAPWLHPCSPKRPLAARGHPPPRLCPLRSAGQPEPGAPRGVAPSCPGEVTHGGPYDEGASASQHSDVPQLAATFDFYCGQVHISRCPVQWHWGHSRGCAAVLTVVSGTFRLPKPRLCPH